MPQKINTAKSRIKNWFFCIIQESRKDQSLHFLLSAFALDIFTFRDIRRDQFYKCFLYMYITVHILRVL